jgi:hypothetical protein
LRRQTIKLSAQGPSFERRNIQADVDTSRPEGIKNVSLNQAWSLNNKKDEKYLHKNTISRLEGMFFVSPAIPAK